MKRTTKLFILAFLVISVIFPICSMVTTVDWSNFGTLVASSSFRTAFSNSLFVTSISTVLSICLAIFLAYVINRTNIKRKAFLKLFIVLPMLIPSVSHGLGLINLFGASGIISRHFGFNIVGSLGIILGSIIYSFPVAFLIIDDGFHYIDNSMYDVATVLGLNKFQTFKKVTMCYMRKPLLSAIFAVFTMIFTDYGVPLAVGGKFITLPVYLYKEVIGLLDYSKGIMIGLFLLIPAIISFIFDTYFKDFNQEIDGKKFVIKENKKRDLIAKIIFYLLILFILILLGSFVYYAFIENPVLDKSLSFTHFDYILKNNVGKYMINSLIISIMAAIVGTFISYVSAYLTARVKGFGTKIIHLLTIVTLAIPGIVLGLSYTICYSGTPIYNTFMILILVNIVHFISSPYLMAYNALQKVDQNYEIVAKTCGISRFKIIKDVLLPCTKYTVREMLVYFFVNSMVTISAVTFLFNTDTMPLSLLINNYEGNLMLGEAAIISLIILAINSIAKFGVYMINRIEDRRMQKLKTTN